MLFRSGFFLKVTNMEISGHGGDNIDSLLSFKGKAEARRNKRKLESLLQQECLPSFPM